MAASDYTSLEGLLSTVKQLGITELTVRRGNVNVELRNAASAPAATKIAPVAADEGSSSDGATIEQAPVSAPEDEGETLKAPFTGTFYRANGLNAPNLIEEGTEAKAGTVICLIEAMKMFNPIKVEKDTKIIRFLLKSGETVQKGAPYAVVKTK